MTERRAGMSGYRSNELPTTEGNNFGRALRGIRVEHNWSMRTLAALGGVDESTIAKVEVGSRKPIRHSDFYKRS